MKKLFSALLATVLVLTPITVTAQYNEKELNQNVSLSDVYADDYFSKCVLTLNSSDLNTMKNNMDSLKSFIHNGGIIVVNNDNDIDNTVSLCQDLNMQFEPEFFSSDTETNSEISNADNGNDIVTMYYNYGNGLSGIYVINTQTDISNTEKVVLIAEAIDDIHTTQNAYSDSLAQQLSSNSSGKTLGSFTVTTTCLPKGKLKATYIFYTVQDLDGKDYYTAKANVVGYPGATLSSSNSNYKSKYKGLSLNTLIKTTTSSVTVDSYGPLILDKTSSYTVSVGESFNANSGTTFGADFEYTKNITDADIEATSTTKQAQWDISLSSTARTKSITFVPAITFDCPASKASVDISCSSKYVLDSWDTFKETVSVSRNVTCKSTNVAAA